VEDLRQSGAQIVFEDLADTGAFLKLLDGKLVDNR